MKPKQEPKHPLENIGQPSTFESLVKLRKTVIDNLVNYQFANAAPTINKPEKPKTEKKR